MLHLNLCISYTGINEFEKAEKHLSDAILFNEIAGSDKNRFLIDMSQAHMLWKMGNEDEVRDHVEELVAVSYTHLLKRRLYTSDVPYAISARMANMSLNGMIPRRITASEPFP